MLIIVGECADDFGRLRKDLMAEYDRQLALESELVERLKVILWRLRRMPFFEGAILNTRHVATWAPGYWTSDETEGEADEDQEKSDWKASVLFG